MQKFFGYIEGYFGRELSWSNRFNMLDHLHSLEMNTYILAPKEDPYHRIKWKTPYPQSILNKIEQMVQYGEQKNISVIPALAPGLTYDYQSPSDYQILLNKYICFLRRGIKHFGLFMDDIDPELPQQNKADFNSLGEAHGKLLEQLLNDLRTIEPRVSIWFCPTIYTNEFLTGKLVDNPYLNDLAATIPEDVLIFWSGDHYVAPTITPDNIKEIADLFQNKIIIWENYYANDYCTLKIHLGPYLDRDAQIIDMSQGILLNPTGLHHTDQFLLSVFSQFVKEGKSDEKTWFKIAQDYQIDERFFPFKEYFWAPFRMTPEPDEKIIAAFSCFYHDFIVKWQNPLKNEWFPYLHGFYSDLQYLDRKKKGKLNKFWLHNVFPPIIAQELDRFNRLKT